MRDLLEDNFSEVKGFVKDFFVNSETIDDFTELNGDGANIEARNFVADMTLALVAMGLAVNALNGFNDKDFFIGSLIVGAVGFITKLVGSSYDRANFAKGKSEVRKQKINSLNEKIKEIDKVIAETVLGSLKKIDRQLNEEN